MNLALFRRANDLTQAKLARATEIKKSTYANYEAGIRSVPINVFRSLSSFYGTTIDALVADYPDDPQEALPCPTTTPKS